MPGEYQEPEKGEIKFENKKAKNYNQISPATFILSVF